MLIEIVCLLKNLLHMQVWDNLVKSLWYAI